MVDAGDLDHEWLLFAATRSERRSKGTREWSFPVSPKVPSAKPPPPTPATVPHP
jgi:hypothetical protein